MAVTQTGSSSAPGPAGCCLHLQFGKLGCSRQLLVSSGVGEQSTPAARLDQVRALWECWEGSTHHHHFNGNMLTASPRSGLNPSCFQRDGAKGRPLSPHRAFRECGAGCSLWAVLMVVKESLYNAIKECFMSYSTDCTGFLKIRDC